MNLPFEPFCAPLLLGSLPYADAVLALEVSRRYAGELLAWPQLWPRGLREQLLAQGAAGFPGLVIDEAAGQVFVDAELAKQQIDIFELAYLEGRVAAVQFSDREASGLFELLRQGSLDGVRAVKGQTLGPISLVMQLIDEQQRPLIYDEALFEAASQFVRMRVAWQQQRLAELGKPVIICLDEPYLEMVGSPFLPIDWDDARDQIGVALQDISGCRAVFAGGTIDWGHLLRFDLDLVIGDVYAHGIHLLGAAESLAAFVEQGGLVGLGLIPTDAKALAHTTAADLVEQLGILLGDLERAGVECRRLLRQAVVTPNGALGALAPAAAEHALRLLAAVSAQLRATL
ncbi:MAG: hypothetical protein H7Z42_11385 [Roseiflexaceae bacterium]|nr:hypothetical protein [Roseiflexaceae bacterium]